MHRRIRSSAAAHSRWIVFGTVAPALLWADIAASAAQELPRGGGPVPPVRRGADGQIEFVSPTAAPPSAATRPGPDRRGAAPAASAPKAGSPKIGHHDAPPAERAMPPPQPPQPVITVTPSTPRVPDVTPLGAVVASYSVRMSDGSPFTGTVVLGAPNYGGKGLFALSGNKIIVSPDGPGLKGAGSGTHHITLETIP